MKSYRRQIVAQVKMEMARRNEAVGLVGETAVKQRTPVDRGILRASYTHIADADSVIVGTDTDYAGPVELGHKTSSGSFVPPQAHLVPGIRASLGAITAIYSRPM